MDKTLYEPNNLKTIFIGFNQFSTLEFEDAGFRILFDLKYALKFKNYIEYWGVDEKEIFQSVAIDCYDFIKNGKQNKRNDLPMKIFSNFGTKINLLNDLKIQFIEETLFGKEYKSEIHTIDFEDEHMIHFWI